ncbi:MAG: hypothetical protein KAQ62_28810, partial [Cyclobacteriaceae bacterium]|nr:hypothetical protein [Cyclobacteriaceae bacterium]
DTLILPNVVDSLTHTISQISENSLISKNIPYNLELLKQERARIDNELKNRGFYYFNQDYILFLVDSVSEDHKVKMKLIIKNNSPSEANQIFAIDNIFVAEDFKLEHYDPDTTQIDNYSIISSSDFMKPKIFLNSVLFDKDDIYSKEKHNNSSRQLMDLRSYKFVNTRFRPSAQYQDKLDLTYLMTPSPKMSVSAELNAVSKSNNFVGPGVKLSFKSRNFLRGAELFSVNLNGRFEKQISGDKKGDTSYEIGVDASLDLPRLIPFKLQKRNKPYLPNASIILGTGLFSRVSLYKFTTFSTGLEYTWRKNSFLTHVVKPIDISVTNLIDATDEFKEFLLYNPSIRKSFEEQFI